MPLFGKSQKSPTEVVKALKDALIALERGDKKSDKVRLSFERTIMSLNFGRALVILLEKVA